MSTFHPKGELREFLREIEPLGWQFDGHDGNDHVRLHHPQTGSRYHVAATPSDCRTRKKDLAALRRLTGADEHPDLSAVELFTYHDDEDRSDRPVRVVIDSPLGEPVWVGRDVCEVVGISKYRDALVQLDGDERVSVVVDTPGGPQEMTAVTEAGVWSLLLISRSPKVKPFKRWLTHKVLPEIRNTGQYTPAPAIPNHAEALRGWADEIERRQVAEAERDTALERAAELETPAAAWTQLAESAGDYEVADAAKVTCGVCRTTKQFPTEQAKQLWEQQHPHQEPEQMSDHSSFVDGEASPACGPPAKERPAPQPAHGAGQPNLTSSDLSSAAFGVREYGQQCATEFAQRYWTGIADLLASAAATS